MTDQQQNNQQNQDQQNQQQGDKPASWDEWLKGQPEEVQGLYSTHITGLRNTVQATRQERDDLAKQIKDLTGKAEKGSELEKSLTEIAGKLDQAERRAAFFEEAGKPEIGCRNPRAAFVVAQAEGLFDRKGNPDWGAIKAAAPEFFGGPSINGNAGVGTNSKPQPASMNDFIRRSAGRS